MKREILCVVGLTATVAAAEIRTVPADHDTIQEAIIASADGDEIVVSPGVYAEALDLLGKRITLRSLAGRDVTILDGGSINTNIMRTQGGENLSTVVRGFTFRDGRGDVIASCDEFSLKGGAIYMEFGSGMTIEDCAFIDCGRNAEEIRGGAIYANAFSNLHVVGCSFSGNGVSDIGSIPGASFGGSIFSCLGISQLRVEDCQFEGGYAAHGGAIYANRTSGLILIDGCSFVGCAASHGGGVRVTVERDVLISDCDFVDNQASFGGGLNIQPWTQAFASQSTVERCRFVNNTSPFGGGAFVTNNGTAIVTIASCEFLDNVATKCCGAGSYFSGCGQSGSSTRVNWGGGIDIRVNGGSTSVVGSLFARNDGAFGSGINIEACGGGDVRLANCTLADNSDNGVFVRQRVWSGSMEPSLVDIANTISWGNGTGPGQQFVVLNHDDPSITLVTDYNVVEGGYVGSGNLSMDPRFVDAAGGNYLIGPNSPAIDSANYDAFIAAGGGPTDLAGLPRTQDDSGTPNTGVGGSSVLDMGAYEFAGTSSPVCPGDWDGSGGAPDSSDFLAYLNDWSVQDPRADLAPPGGDGAWDSSDFLAYLNAYVAGC